MMSLFHIGYQVFLTGIIFCLCSLNVSAEENAISAENIPANIEIDIKTQKTLSSAKELILKEDWKEAFLILNELIQTQRNPLVKINEFQNLNLKKYCHYLISQSSPEGLKIYRELVDQNSKHWHDQFKKNQDKNLLLKILQESYTSSFGDDALFSLGELAWSEGEISLARHYWSQLISLPNIPTSSNEFLILRYPDSNRSRTDILARLFLCSLVEGDRTRAKLELQAFSHLYPNARGILSGRSGNLSKILETKLIESENWHLRDKNPEISTFGNHFTRTNSTSKPLDIGAKLYSLNAPRVIIPNKPRTQFQLPYHPVTFDNKLFLNNELNIYAWDVKTGHPAWSEGENSSAVIYSSRLSKKEIQPTQSISGNSHFSLTIDQGYLFARMGTPVLSRSKKELREIQSELICLNLKDAEGKLEWMISSRDIGKNAVFEGSPIIKNDRGFVTVRQSDSDLSIELYCFDKKTGKPIWIQSMSSLTKPINGMNSILGHQLLSADDLSLYYQIHNVGLISLSQKTGQINWVYSFKKNHLSADDMISPYLIPPIIFNNQVFLINNINQTIIALDSEMGTEIWKKKVNENIEHLLGIDNRRLIISGKKLFAINIFNGSVEWQLGYENSTGKGYGRGMIAGHLVYWPTVEELFLVNTQTGKIKHRNHLKHIHGISGGNILITDKCTIVSGKENISILSPFGKIQQKKSEDQTISLFDLTQ